MKLIHTYPLGLRSSLEDKDPKSNLVAILLINDKETFFEEYVAKIHPDHNGSGTRVSLEWRRTSRRDSTGWTWGSDSRVNGSMDRIHPLVLEELARIARAHVHVHVPPD